MGSGSGFGFWLGSGLGPGSGSGFVVGRGDGGERARRVDRHALPVRVVALHADVHELRLLLVAVVGREEERERGDVGEGRAVHVHVALALLVDDELGDLVRAVGS